MNTTISNYSPLNSSPFSCLTHSFIQPKCRTWVSSFWPFPSPYHLPNPFFWSVIKFSSVDLSSSLLFFLNWFLLVLLPLPSPSSSLSPIYCNSLSSGISLPLGDLLTKLSVTSLTSLLFLRQHFSHVELFTCPPNSNVIFISHPFESFLSLILEYHSHKVLSVRLILILPDPVQASGLRLGPQTEWIILIFEPPL